MKTLKQFLVALALVVASSSTLASAQEPDTGRSTEFQAVEGRSAEEVSGFAMMVGSYGLIWLFLFGFVARVAKLQSETSAALAELEKSLGEGDGSR